MTAIRMTGWVVTHREKHDDIESLQRAVTDYASNSSVAWHKFMRLVGGSKRDWKRRGYIAQQVKFDVRIVYRE